MARSSYHLFTYANLYYFFSTCFCILLLLLLLDFPGNTVSQSMVPYLPGFGPLPFELETGYVTVDDSNGDPLLFWFTGGPGCSGLSAIMTEIGPLSFEKVKYNGSLPTLILNPYSWTKVSNIVFLDAPVDTGFSYSRSLQGSFSSNTIFANHSHTFIRKWLLGHPEFLSNPLYVAAYSRHTVKGYVIVSDILYIQGYLLGNPVTNQNLEVNSQIPFAYGMGIISYELFKSAKKNCRGNYVNVDPSNLQCKKDLQAFTECTEGIYRQNILDPVCSYSDANKIIRDRRLLRENSSNIILPPPKGLELWCRHYNYLPLHYWANDYGVQAALNVRKGTVMKWIRCNFDVQFLFNVESSIGYHLYLSKKGYRSLIYSGDHDMDVPSMSTQAWIRSLKSSISDEWRQWLVNDQVAGYTRTYSNNLTYASVKARCFFLFPFF
ncbi:hypothetical protein AQUCO_10900027v1 [Aquilegia coerulea]|uniref:Uncharacterized protein n=1 Tax=Aquilegia coerulea TaxID=218851 RepID=A0A2G5C335_AQUCA|nr:hypothetical protein AQUCO_10900027v1 [Aquilegia coerulea]